MAAQHAQPFDCCGCTSASRGLHCRPFTADIGFSCAMVCACGRYHSFAELSALAHGGSLRRIGRPTRHHRTEEHASLDTISTVFCVCASQPLWEYTIQSVSPCGLQGWPLCSVTMLRPSRATDGRMRCGGRPSRVIHSHSAPVDFFRTTSTVV